MSTPFSLRAELKGVEVAPGVTLRYWEAGAGRALVMLPGLGHAASLYKYQLEGLCDEFRVIALDPRGHGESDKPEGGYNYHTLAKDLDGFLRALDLNDVTILGHSGGCKIILTYLELYGDSRLRAIVFSDDSPCHLRDGIFSADQALAAIDAFQGPDAIAFSKGFSDQFLTDDAEESAKEAFYREGLKLPRPYLAKLFRWAAFGDWWDAYALVKVPTLVIGGRVSKVPVKIAQGIHEAVPGSSFVVFEADEGGGHAMFWEGPQKYNDSLRTFLRSSSVMKLFGAWFSGAVIADEQTQTGGQILHRDKASAGVATQRFEGNVAAPHDQTDHSETLADRRDERPERVAHCGEALRSRARLR